MRLSSATNGICTEGSDSCTRDANTRRILGCTVGIVQASDSEREGPSSVCRPVVLWRCHTEQVLFVA